MKVLYYDCFSGISGDMNLGAMIDLGVDKKYLIDELKKLNLSESEYEIQVKKDNRKGIYGTKVDVLLNPHHNHIHNEDEHHHSHHHEHTHEQNQNNHNHLNIHIYNEETKGVHKDHTHEEYTHTHTHEHRSFKDIEEMIKNSALSEKVKKLSLGMFMNVAKAEAKVHYKPLYEVHFHEVGAVDSIIDIVGAAICLDYLNVDKIISSPVELGGGFVRCAHGLIPVPAPATVEILKGIPIKSGVVPFETTTPTGAAILVSNAKEFTEVKDFKIEKVAYGIGNRDTDIPNVLRVYLGITEENELMDCKREDSVIVECNIDDMNPEMYDYVMEKLFESGAEDVYLTPIIMKKNRPAVKLSVLCKNKRTDVIENIIFKETTTLGVRKYKVNKELLERKIEIINTKFGDIRVKNAIYNGKILKSKPEYEDCKKIAKENNIEISKVYSIVKKEMN